MIYQNGDPADDFAVFNIYQNSVDIQTDKDEMVGIQKTIIRSCDNLERLLELNLYIQVKSNTYPEFDKEP